MRSSLLILALVALPSALQAAGTSEASAANANPIRKVVNLLMAMEAKVKKEGEKEEKLYEKFVCYCKTGASDLQKSIEKGGGQISSLGSEIKMTQEQKVQTEESLKQAQVDRTGAKKTIAEATALREKEAAAYAAFKEESTENIAAVNKASAAIEKGMGSAFLQTGAAQLLRKLVETKQDQLEDGDREELLSFLGSAQGSDYAPQSGQVTGILKQLGDEMSKNLAEATATEEGAVKTYEELMAAKKKEVSVLTAAIETKMERVGELGVALVQMQGDLGDTEEALMADKEFLANLDESCAKKKKEWEIREKTRGEELLALADTIKLLNDDDALELFKKTLPSAASSFVEVRTTAGALRARALAALEKAHGAKGPQRVRLDLIALALRGKKIGFEKVIAMVDEMVATLKKEQADDDNKKEYCLAQFDLSDDKKKALERAISDKETSIDNAKEGIATLTEEIAALKAGIVELDKSVAEATEQRKKENEEYKELMSSNAAAKELLAFAKNRLNKFYNPKLYKPPAKKELSAEDRISSNMGVPVFAQISAHSRLREAPPPPPETFGAYAKKSEENTGVMAMVDLLVKDLDKEMTEAEVEETDAQADYETLMKDSATKRTEDSKSLTEKESTKAELEEDLEAHKLAKASTTKALHATLKYIASLHAECDWLLKYFDMRKEARTSEIDAMEKAKAVLSGADYSLLQASTRGLLRGSA